MAMKCYEMWRLKKTEKEKGATIHTIPFYFCLVWHIMILKICFSKTNTDAFFIYWVS